MKYQRRKSKRELKRRWLFTGTKKTLIMKIIFAFILALGLSYAFFSSGALTFYEVKNVYAQCDDDEKDFESDCPDNATKKVVCFAGATDCSPKDCPIAPVN